MTHSSEVSFKPALIISGLVLLVLVTFIYSYVVWKNDPKKQRIGR